MQVNTGAFPPAESQWSCEIWLRSKEWCWKNPQEKYQEVHGMISRADKVSGERLRGEASTDMIRAYKHCQHDSRDEQRKESLLSDGKQALGRAAMGAGGVEGIPWSGDTPGLGWREGRGANPQLSLIPKALPAVLVPISVVSTTYTIPWH